MLKIMLLMTLAKLNKIVDTPILNVGLRHQMKLRAQLTN